MRRSKIPETVYSYNAKTALPKKRRAVFCIFLCSFQICGRRFRRIIPKNYGWQYLSFPFNRNPDFAVVAFVLGAVRVFGVVIIHFHTIAGCELVFFNGGKPLGEYFCVHILQGIRQGTHAGGTLPM